MECRSSTISAELNRYLRTRPRGEACGGGDSRAARLRRALRCIALLRAAGCGRSCRIRTAGAIRVDVPGRRPGAGLRAAERDGHAHRRLRSAHHRRRSLRCRLGEGDRHREFHAEAARSPSARRPSARCCASCTTRTISISRSTITTATRSRSSRARCSATGRSSRPTRSCIYSSIPGRRGATPTVSRSARRAGARTSSNSTTPKNCASGTRSGTRARAIVADGWVAESRSLPQPLLRCRPDDVGLRFLAPHPAQERARYGRATIPRSSSPMSARPAI